MFTDLNKLMEALQKESGNKQQLLDRLKKGMLEMKGLMTVRSASKPCPSSLKDQDDHENFLGHNKGL